MSAPRDASTDEALRLFESWMLRYHEGEHDFEAFCAEHPAHEGAFRRWWQRLVEAAEVDSSDGSSGAREGHESPTSVEIDDDTGLPEVDSVFGAYRLEHELGRGSQGAVFLATDTRLGRKVALKILPAWRLQGGSHARRFAREAELASRLDHPGLCSIYERGALQGTAFLAMRYVDGETLAQRIAREKTEHRRAGDLEGHALRMADISDGNSENDAITLVLQLFEQICDALAAAHDARLIHRDIKPGNILLDTKGRPVLLDFGLARHLEEDELTLTGDLVGTPAYMSPEQIAAQRIELDQRSDIYSLGATLFECLTLRRPFEAATRTELYQQILTAEAPSARRFNRAIPRDLVIVLATALEKDRNRRYQTARDFAEDLRRVRMLEPIRARPASSLTKLSRWTQRNPRTAIGVSIVFAALSVALIISLLSLADKERAQAAFARLAQRTKLASARADGERLLDMDSPSGRASPERLAALEAWMTDQGRPLASGLPELKKRRDELRVRALPESEASIREYRAQHPAARRRARLEQELIGFRDHEPRRKLSETAKGFIQAAIEDHTARIRECEAEVAAARPWRFASPEEQVAYESLVPLIHEIERFAGPTGLYARVEREIALLEAFRSRLTSDVQLWQDVRERLAGNVRYATSDLAVQHGLVPLGADTRSQLEEFAVMESGAIPRRDEDGKLILTDESAVVLVLVPAAEYTLGSRRVRTNKMEAPVSGFVVARFFISKYELTMGQWRRLGGPDAADGARAAQRMGLERAGPRHPLQSVSWTTTRRYLRYHALDIPTEVQWEYAARGGRDRPLPFPLREFLTGRPANLRDVSFLRIQKPDEPLEIRYDDGSELTAAVGTYPPNGFGLHDVIGNIAEWTRESFFPVSLANFAREEGDCFHHVPGSNHRGVRGGSYESGQNTYLGQRSRRHEEQPWRDVGVRPVRRVE